MVNKFLIQLVQFLKGCQLIYIKKSLRLLFADCILGALLWPANSYRPILIQFRYTQM